ncbi:MULTISPECIES: DUF7503 family protein [Saliphagus]|uniref:Uncharacterized protein n=1 Tax=Saliphagus infecundisoli TaxID=1849069 RepID=A0ABD5QFJ4_9EURY|nr:MULTISPECIES: hypothetical protein [Saliphagus]
MEAKDDLKAYIESNPRMIGALFTVMLLLSQAGSVAAGAVSSNPGP